MTISYILVLRWVRVCLNLRKNMFINTPSDEKLCHFQSRIFSKVSQKKKFISEVISFFLKSDLGNFFSSKQYLRTLLVGVLNAKTPLPGAESKIWPLKSAPEVTYFASPN